MNERSARRLRRSLRILLAALTLAVGAAAAVPHQTIHSATLSTCGGCWLESYDTGQS